MISQKRFTKNKGEKQQSKKYEMKVLATQTESKTGMIPDTPVLVIMLIYLSLF